MTLDCDWLTQLLIPEIDYAQNPPAYREYRLPISEASHPPSPQTDTALVLESNIPSEFQLEISLNLLQIPDTLPIKDLPQATCTIMAIYSSVPPPSQQASPNPPNASASIEQWTVSALQSLSVSPSARERSTGVTLSIPLDTVADHSAKSASSRVGKEPLRRDSLKRREALLKGKEGSRRRQRWENGKLENAIIVLSVESMDERKGTKTEGRKGRAC